MERQATIKDIVRKLNISISTVSHALRNAHDVTPQISSVEQPCFEMGKLAAKLFIETIHLDTDMSNVDVVLKTKLFVRQSLQRLVPENNRFK